jgi:hypothetical protein
VGPRARLDTVEKNLLPLLGIEPWLFSPWPTVIQTQLSWIMFVLWFCIIFRKLYVVYFTVPGHIEIIHISLFKQYRILMQPQSLQNCQQTTTKSVRFEVPMAGTMQSTGGYHHHPHIGSSISVSWGASTAYMWPQYAQWDASTGTDTCRARKWDMSWRNRNRFPYCVQHQFRMYWPLAYLSSVHWTQLKWLCFGSSSTCWSMLLPCF